MELIKHTKTYLIFAVITVLFLFAFVLSGCGNKDNFEISNNADYLFVVKSNYKSANNENPLCDLLKISDDEKNIVSFNVEDSSVISVQTDGEISTCECQDQKVTYVTANTGEKTYNIKVVVAGDYNPDTYKNYENLYIPYGETTIGDEYKGSDISYLNIPGTINEISKSAFSGCKKLHEVVIQEKITSLSEGLFMECANLKYISLPTTLTTISASAFRECDSLEYIYLYDGITLIDDFAFYSCGNLIDINFPSSLSYIGERAFCNCSNITSITIPENIYKINNDTFSSCYMLSELKLPTSLESIGERAFLNCRGLTSLEIPESVTSLGLDAFSGCINIKSLTMPLTLPVDKSIFPSVASIEYFRFTGNGDGYDYTAGNYVNTPWYICRNHRIKVDIEEGITSIGDYTFVHCYGLTEINLPNSLNKICHGAFRKCYNIESIVIPDNVTVIELYAFSLDYALTDITLPNNLYKIESYAFYGCIGLTQVDIPDSVTIIDEYAYSGCNNINSISLGKTTKSNLKYIGVRAFAGFLFDCKEVSIKSKKLKYVASGAFGYIGEEKPVYTVATLGRESNIYVTSYSIKKLFVADKNYNSNDTSVGVR